MSTTTSTWPTWRRIGTAGQPHDLLSRLLRAVSLTESRKGFTRQLRCASRRTTTTTTAAPAQRPSGWQRGSAVNTPSSNSARRIAVNHYPEIARRLVDLAPVRSGVLRPRSSGTCRADPQGAAADPGEVMGRFGRPTFACYDCATGQFQLHDVRHYPATGGAYRAGASMKVGGMTESRALCWTIKQDTQGQVRLWT